MRSFIVCLVTMVGIVAAADAAQASITMTIPSHEKDGEVRNLDVLRPPLDRHTMAVGRAGGTKEIPKVPLNSSILFFELPSVVSGDDILESQLKVTRYRGYWDSEVLSPGENVDLYGLGYVSELPTDLMDLRWYFSGDQDTRTGSDLGTNIGNTMVTKIADDYITSQTSADHNYTDEAASTALTGFIRGVYDEHGAEGGDYLVLRLSANQEFPRTASPYHRYHFYSGNNDPANQPTLTLTVVPAPSSLTCVAGLFAIGLIASWWRRRVDGGVTARH